ncbi:hypothetical protein Tco_0636392 [Tanacetum coccineum]
MNTLVAFQGKVDVRYSFITGVPEVMKISSFMDAYKCLELAKRYSDKVPRTVDVMMTRVDDFDGRPIPPGGYRVDRRRNEGRSAFNSKEGLVPYRAQAPIKHLGRLNLQPPRPMQLPPKKENQDRYCDYHGEKGHYTNDCFQIKRLLEIALKSGKHNHLIKDVRQKGRGNAKGKDAGKDKFINMIRSWLDDKKRKSSERDENRMKVPIVFPPLSVEDVSDEPLIIEAVMKGYLVRRVYVDQGASLEVMSEHCFENLYPTMRSRLRSTQMDLVGFRRRGGETIKEDRIGGGLQRRWFVQDRHD